jgi:hypothetical protein
VRSLTKGHAKMIAFAATGKAAFYDPRRDPGEQHPIEPASIADSLKSDLDHFSESHPPRFPTRRRGRQAAGPPAPGDSAAVPGTPQQANPSPSDETPEKPEGEQEREDEELRRREQNLRSFGYVD